MISTQEEGPTVGSKKSAPAALFLQELVLQDLRHMRRFFQELVVQELEAWLPLAIPIWKEFMMSGSI